MADKKVDYQKLNSIKAKWLDKLREIDQLTLQVNQLVAPYQNSISALQQEAQVLKNEVELEESRIKK